MAKYNTILNNHKDIIGKKVGKLTILELSNDKFDNNGTTRLWKCKCKCGNIVYKSFAHLNEAVKKNLNLGCLDCVKSSLIGNKYGDCQVIKLHHRKKRTKYWLCQCICGDTFVRDTNTLKRGTYKCLKLQKQRTQYIHRIRMIFSAMKRRCYCSNDHAYKNYGKRCIKICDEWLNDANKFIEWSLNNGYKPNLSIDRINNNGNYEPNNCRWADNYIQANNKRNNLIIEYNGKKQALKKWCRELELPYRKTHKRLYMYHWTVDRAFAEKERVGFI